MAGSMSKVPDYQSEEWADVIPIPQNEGGPNPLAAIAYTDEYSEASDYLRAVMASNEKSERVLQLTEHVIRQNPAHYTVWIYRASVLEALSVKPEQELAFLTSISLKHLKNYQIWHHRQVIMSQLAAMPDTEPEFLAAVLRKDAKNYHVWSYRQWLVSHFGLWSDNDGDDQGDVSTHHPDGPDGELRYVEALLDEDVRNNSAWHHRYFVVFGKPGREGPDRVSPTALAREIGFAKAKVKIAPQNQSAWNYLQGAIRKTAPTAGRQATEAKAYEESQAQANERERNLVAFALDYADPDKPDDVRSTFALEFLIGVWTRDGQRDKATKALDLLANVYDPIRKKYWTWKKAKLEEAMPAPSATAAAAA